MTYKQFLSHFLEQSTSLPARLVRGFLILSIFVSVFASAVHIWRPDIIQMHVSVFLALEYIIAAIFTIEFLVRLYSAPSLKQFFSSPFTYIDLIAILPTFADLLFTFTAVNAATLEGVRVLRVLRVVRLARVLRLFRHKGVFSDILQYKNTVLESITPVLLIFLLSKSLIWFLESRGWWIATPDVGELFAIVGFSLGIVLSQKIEGTYQKFIQVEEACVRICGALQGIETILTQHGCTDAKNVCKKWAADFLQALGEKETSSIHKTNDPLYALIKTVESDPSDFSMLYVAMYQDACFCLSKSHRLTPKAYDTLLHQAIIVYLLLMTLFIPGAAGLVTVIIGTYVLYGMYNVTQDLDSIIGGEYNLMNINLSELESIANS